MNFSFPSLPPPTRWQSTWPPLTRNSMRWSCKSEKHAPQTYPLNEPRD